MEKRYAPLLFLFFLLKTALPAQPGSGAKAGEKASVQGRVTDAKTGEALAYVTLQFDGGAPVLSDVNGFFKITADRRPAFLKVSYLGYLPQAIAAEGLPKTGLSIKLEENAGRLAEVTVRPKKYSRKNNPAVDLIAEVFAHKDENRKEGLDFYQYEKYEKLLLGLNGITPKFKRRWYFRPFPFMWDYCDTSEVTQRVSLAYYLRERAVERYYRRDPRGLKERLLGERAETIDEDGDLDEEGISAQMTALYADVDIYEPSILLIDRQFIGPLSGAANAFYRFYINDTTTEADGAKYANVFFAPRNKADLAFMGTLAVALDGTYAVRRVDMGVTKEANLNFVSDCRIQQEFEWLADSSGRRRLLLARDAVAMDFKMRKYKEGRSLIARRTAFYHKYRLNEPLPDSLFSSKQLMLRDTGDVKKRDSLFWEKKQTAPLDPPEAGIAAMYDELEASRPFQILAKTGKTLSTGYYRWGKIDIGEVASVASWNGLEGVRLRLGLRTNRRLSQRWQLAGYAAYGLDDLAWKGGATATIALPGARFNRFPNNQFRFSYEHDLRPPGLTQIAQQGTLFTSFQRGATDRLLLNRTARAGYTREWQNHWALGANYQRREVSGAGGLLLDPPAGGAASLVSSELGGYVRFAPNEAFYQGAVERYAINNRWPVFLFQWKAGLKNVLGGDYGYQRAALRIDKLFYLRMLGRTQCSVEAGQIFGKVSYPLLEAHPANQTYFFSTEAFNLMNSLEFVSDRYATLQASHDFGGILLNRIPLVKKARLREAASFKMAVGSLSEKNRPTASNRLLPLPEGTFSFSKKPYAEASAGISNIFGSLRLDYVWRLSYLENPGVARWGVRLSAGFGF